MPTNYGWGLPVAASTFAGDIDFGIKLIHASMFVIFGLWALFFTYLLIRYRRREGVPARHVHGNIWASLIPDFFVLVFEIGLIAFYAIPAWSRIKMVFPKPESALTVELVAEQFAWSFRYAGRDGKFGRRDKKFVNMNNPMGLDPEDLAGKDDIVTANELYAPMGKPVLIEMSSKDVIHSFFVPELRVKQDIVPGMKIPVWFEPTRIGHYEIGCAQLCGFGHSFMRGDLYVTSQEDFSKWLKTQKPALPL